MTQSSVLTLTAQPFTLQRLISVARIWAQRRQTRHTLGKLTDHMLRDIGLDPLTAQSEATKPFWRA